MPCGRITRTSSKQRGRPRNAGRTWRGAQEGRARPDRSAKRLQSSGAVAGRVRGPRSRHGAVRAGSKNRSRSAALPTARTSREGEKVAVGFSVRCSRQSRLDQRTGRQGRRSHGGPGQQGQVIRCSEAAAQREFLELVVASLGAPRIEKP